MSSRNERPKQVDRILDYMRRYGSITTLDAMLDLGILAPCKPHQRAEEGGCPHPARLGEGHKPPRGNVQRTALQPRWQPCRHSR